MSNKHSIAPEHPSHPSFDSLNELCRPLFGGNAFGDPREEQAVHLLPGREPFMLDRQVAAVYGVPTRRLMEQVRRNAQHFDSDMLFQLTAEELKSLRSQNATAPVNQYLPYGFTQIGANHVAFFLKSEQALERSKKISRYFVAFENLLRSAKGRSELGKLARSQPETAPQTGAVPDGKTLMDTDRVIEMYELIIAMQKEKIEHLKSGAGSRKAVSLEEVRRILKLAAAGYGYADIAKAVGRKKETVETVLRRERQRQASLKKEAHQ
ncbi:ORF6N domain-containing protein [Syntrophus aciditrophicus]|nr:ORF6N domain-containing protein [Syntrophus aciditrophicus]